MLVKQIVDLDSKESKSGLTEEDLLRQSKIKGELQDIVLRKKLVGDKIQTTKAEIWGKTRDSLTMQQWKKSQEFISSLKLDGSTIDMEK